MNPPRISTVVLPFLRHACRGMHSKFKKEHSKKPLATKFDFDLDPRSGIEEAIKSGSMSARCHPGIRKMGPVVLPDQFLKAALKILEDYSSHNVEGDANKLSRYIWSRHPPIDKFEYADKLNEIEQSVIRREKVDPMSPSICDEERRSLLDSRLNKVKIRMKRQVYNWEPIDFNAHNSILYLISRAAPDYASLIKILTEIKMKDPQFNPRTMLDFGSGVGTGMWAMDQIWPESCKEAVCIDVSDDMNTLADKLLRGGSMDKERKVRPGGTFFKQFLPMSDVLKYNMVIASRSLFEQPNIESRLRTLDVLWRKTSDYLIIVEAGTNAGYKLVLEARDYILQMYEREHDETLLGHVCSPCPSEIFCPRYLDGKNIPCNFNVNYELMKFPRKQIYAADVYSYIVLKKGPNTEVERYPRVVMEPILRKKHIICELCTKYGTLSRFTATKGKHSKECYNVVKHSHVGDLLPVVFPEPVKPSLNISDVQTPVVDYSSDEEENGER